MESIKLAIASITQSKLRSSLTLLGIAIGLFSIIIVMTAISAIQQSVVDAFNQIGTNNYIIQKYPAVRIGHGSWRKYRNRKDLTIELGMKLKKVTTLPKAVGIAAVRSGRTAKYGNNKTNPDVSLIGANQDEFVASSYNVAEGRGLTANDLKHAKRICIIGETIRKKLFPNVYPIGQEIRIDNFSLEVVGVFEEIGSILGQGQDNFVLIPITLYKKVFGDHRSIQYTISAPEGEVGDKTIDEVIGALRTLRKVPPGVDNDFEIVTNDQLIGQFNDITKYFKIGAAVVAFIALLAAGIGIMNIMMVSVTERTREIGIRKAIGAKKRIIREQFVIEAVVLSQIGGLIGILLGVIGGNIVAAIIGVSVILPYDWILIGLLVTSAVGVIFGVWPAIKASNLDPIDALRYE